jgi:hypothetical protein
MLLTITCFTGLALTTPVEPVAVSDSNEGMALRLRFDKNQYRVGDVITVSVDYRNINGYPITFRPPNVFIIEYNYGHSPGEYPVTMYGWSVSPPELVGRSCVVPAHRVYHLTSFELAAEEEGNLFVAHHGYVITVRILR